MVRAALTSHLLQKNVKPAFPGNTYYVKMGLFMPLGMTGGVWQDLNYDLTSNWNSMYLEARRSIPVSVCSDASRRLQRTPWVITSVQQAEV